MSWLFGSGFDLYSLTTINQFWSASFADALASTYSRWATGQGIACNPGNYVNKTWGTNEATLIAGAAINPAGGVGLGDVIRFRDGTTIQVALVILASGAVGVYRGGSAGTQLAVTAAGVVVTNIFHYFEIKATIHNTAGAFEVRMDGNPTPILTGTSQNTRSSANNYANDLQVIGGGGGLTYFDDIYLINTAGSINNDFLGDTRIEGLVPTGAGAHTDWTPSTGANWQNVDDVPPNDNTDYNYSNTVGNKDTYAMHDLTSLSGTIRAVQHTLRARKDDAGTRKIAPLFRIGGTDYQGTDQTLSTSFQTIQQIYEVSPATSAAWTVSEINALESGVALSA